MKSQKASLGFIFVTVVIDAIGLGIVIPIMPELIETLSGGSLSEAAPISGWLTFCYAVMQFIFAPLLGTLSDRFGRRPVILFALVGLGIDYLLHAFAPSLVWLFIGRLLAGFCGATHTVAMAYIADISTPEKKAQNFGLVGAAFGLGFILGPGIGGLVGELSLQMPFIVAAVLCFINMLYGYFVLPESLPPEKRIKKVELKNTNPIGGILLFRNNPVVVWFLIPFFLMYIASYSIQSTWSFYTMYRFDWSKSMVGFSLVVVGVIVAIVQGGLIKHVVKFYGEHRTIIYGMIFWIVGLILFALANEPWMMFAITLPYCLGGVAGPTLQGIISNVVPENMQGQLQGTLTSVIGLTAIIGPPFMTNIFEMFTGESAIFEFPGAPFFIGAIVMFISFIMIIRMLNKIRSIKS